MGELIVTEFVRAWRFEAVILSMLYGTVCEGDWAFVDVVLGVLGI